MVTLNFDTGIEDVDVTGTVVYATDFEDERFGQHSHITGDGDPVAFDFSGFNIITGVIVIKGVIYTEGLALRTWLHDEAIFALEEFIITTPDGIDLGLGKGVNLTSVKFKGKSDNGVFKYSQPGIYTINFPYRLKRS